MTISYTFLIDKSDMLYFSSQTQTIKIPVIYQDKEEEFNANLVYQAEQELIPLGWLQGLNYRRFENGEIPLEVIFDQEITIREGAELTPSKITGEWIDAMEYLNREYTSDWRDEVKFLDLENKKLTGILDLTIFPNLEQVNCSHNFLRGIKTPAGVKNIQAANNSISSPQQVKINWADSQIKMNLLHNPLNLNELVQIIQGLQKNSVNERFEINRLKKSLAVVQANHDKAKIELERAQTNWQENQKEQKNKLRVSQETISELNRQLKEKEEELNLRENNQENQIPTSPANSWWKEYKTPLIIIGVGSVVFGIYYCGKKFSLF